MDEEDEWATELTENIERLLETDNCQQAKSMTVTGSAVRKQRGKAIITGNYRFSEAHTTTLIYDESTEDFKTHAYMKIARFDHAAVTLPDGNVAVFCGHSIDPDQRFPPTCEVYDATTTSFSITACTEGRSSLAAASLFNGDVLLVGGENATGQLRSCVIYLPRLKRFKSSNAKLTTARSEHTASMLPDGRVIVCGGWGHERNALSDTEIYDPSTDSFSAGPPMRTARVFHTAATLHDGRILVAGGSNSYVLATTEIYSPLTNSFSRGPDMVVFRTGHFACTLSNGKVLIGGGLFQSSTEVYDPETNSFSRKKNLLSGVNFGAAAAY